MMTEFSILNGNK